MSSSSSHSSILLENDVNNTQTTISKCVSQYPFRMMQIEHWRSYVSVSMLGFGGGLVSKDCINVDVKLQSRAVSHFRTVGSTKVFKAQADNFCVQRIGIKALDSSLLVFTPDVTTCYEGSKFQQILNIQLNASASIVLVDWYSSGRKDRDPAWSAKQINNFISLKVENEALFVENQELLSNHYGSLSSKLGNMDVVGMIILCGPALQAIRVDLTCFQKRQTFQEKRKELLHIQSRRNMLNGRESLQESGEESIGQSEQSAKKRKKVEDSSSKQQNIASRPLVSVTELSSEALLLRFTCSTVQYAYEFLYELLSPLSSIQEGLTPYQDRIHRSSFSSNRDNEAIHSLDSSVDDPYCIVQTLKRHRQSSMKT